MVSSKKLGIVLGAFCTLAIAACTEPGMRKAWHTLTNTEKLAYLNAELCLMKTPGTLGVKGAKSKFDEFQGVHQALAYYTHFTGAFLPFHRLYVYAHEEALRKACNYSGYQPYWDEPRDAGKFKSSIVFDSTYGFGGDGSGSKGCITTGPFANYTNVLGPGYEITNHCIDRRIDDSMSKNVGQSSVDTCMAKTDYGTFWPCIEEYPGPHSGGHAGVGGQMGNGVSSPGDPLFWLHHTWLDKLLWDWQAKDRTKRTTTITGTNIGRDSAPGFPTRPSSIPKATGAEGDPGTTTTLNHVLNMMGLTVNKTIGEIMDIQGSFLCYKYGDP